MWNTGMGKLFDSTAHGTIPKDKSFNIPKQFNCFKDFDLSEDNMAICSRSVKSVDSQASYQRHNRIIDDFKLACRSPKSIKKKKKLRKHMRATMPNTKYDLDNVSLWE